MAHLFFHREMAVAWKIPGVLFVDSLILLRFSVGIWAASVACRGLCLQGHKDSCPAKGKGQMLAI